jgi:hypothetical protein
MAGYWGPVLSGAWEKTRNPLGWDRKKFAVALLALGTVIATGIHYGWIAMIENATGVFWLAFPPAFASVILFVWGVIETQANLYSELAIKTASNIAALESNLTKLQGNKPNYAAVRLMHQFHLGPASRLWCDIDQNAPSTRESQAWQEAFQSAIQRGELNFVPRIPNVRELEEYEKQNPNHDTIVTREDFEKFAVTRGDIPKFLRDE